MRHAHKGGLKDLEKAKFYLENELDRYRHAPIDAELNPVSFFAVKDSIVEKLMAVASSESNLTARNVFTALASYVRTGNVAFLIIATHAVVDYAKEAYGP